MKIAIEGCAHGELEKIYDLIGSIQEEQNVTIDLLICCGDFQSTRNLQDLQCMAVPQKHLDMGSFYKYYSGEKKAPMLTLFIGGNHEASNYLQELPYGGWVAPNIYYLGYAGVVDCNGIRIGGISGIYKGHDFLKGRFEFPPYDEGSKRSIYHQRQIDVFRLKQLSPGVDIMLSHDWPRGVTRHGNETQLLRFKPAFREDIESNRLGSAPCEELLRKLQPPYWFAAHLHCKFAALVTHSDEKCTKFLALDKCLPKRRFLQILDIPTEVDGDAEGKKQPVHFKYDLEWLTILNLTNHLISIRTSNGYMPGEGGSGERFNFTPSEEEKAKVLERFDNDLTIPDNFVRIAEPYQPNDDGGVDMRSVQQPQAFLNPQTTFLCDKLNIDDPLRLAMLMTGHKLNTSTYVDRQTDKEKEEPIEGDLPRVPNADQLELTDDDDDDDDDDDGDLEQGIEALENSPEKQKTPSQTKLSLSSILPQPKWRQPQDSHDSDLSTTFNDSTPNCSVLSLPTPQKTGDNNTSTLSESALAVDDLKLSSPVQREEEGQDNPPVKKFKRRNQTIYANDECE